MKPRSCLVPLVLFTTWMPVGASQINPLDLSKLAPQSEFIVVGEVNALLESDASSDTISVRIVSTIKGKSEATSFSLRLRNKGVKDFDPVLAKGDQCVFFLKSLKDSKANLTYWGSIAVLPKGNFTLAAAKPGGKFDPFQEYKGKEPVPEGLREAYTGFALAAPSGDVRAYLLPQAVGISKQPRPSEMREYGEEVNEEYLKKGFSPMVRSVRKDGDENYLIRTGSTALWFVQIKSGAWKIYRYRDKPIQ